MNKKLLLTSITAVAALLSTAQAQITVVDFGESSTYVTSSQNLADGNGSFSTSNISPAANYSGPAFWGGVSRGMDTWQLTDNNEGFSTTGDFDNIRGRLGTAAIGVSATYAFMFSASQTFAIDNTTDSSFYLNARRVGGQTEAGVTGVRWLLRDTDNNYYVSALNDTTAAQYSGAYSETSGVTQSSLLGIDWFNYTFTSGVVGASVGNTSTFFGETQFDAAGFNYTAKRVTSASAIEMQFADFTVVAIPEPSTLVLMVLGFAGALITAKRRRGKA